MFPHSDFLALATHIVLYTCITGYFVRPARPVLLITAPPPVSVPTLVFGPWDGVPYYVSPLACFLPSTPWSLEKLRWVITSFGGMWMVPWRMASMTDVSANIPIIDVSCWFVFPYRVQSLLRLRSLGFPWVGVTPSSAFPFPLWVSFRRLGGFVFCFL